MTLALVLLYKALLEETVARRKAAKKRPAEAPPAAEGAPEPTPAETRPPAAGPIAQVVDTRDAKDAPGEDAVPPPDDRGAAGPK